MHACTVGTGHGRPRPQGTAGGRRAPAGIQGPCSAAGAAGALRLLSNHNSRPQEPYRGAGKAGRGTPERITRQKQQRKRLQGPQGTLMGEERQKTRQEMQGGRGGRAYLGVSRGGPAAASAAAPRQLTCVCCSLQPPRTLAGVCRHPVGLTMRVGASSPPGPASNRRGRRECGGGMHGGWGRRLPRPACHGRSSTQAPKPLASIMLQPRCICRRSCSQGCGGGSGASPTDTGSTVHCRLRPGAQAASGGSAVLQF